MRVCSSLSVIVLSWCSGVQTSAAVTSECAVSPGMDPAGLDELSGCEVTMLQIGAAVSARTTRDNTAGGRSHSTFDCEEMPKYCEAPFHCEENSCGSFVQTNTKLWCNFLALHVYVLGRQGPEEGCPNPIRMDD